MLIKPFFEFLNKVFDTKNKKIIWSCLFILLMIAIYNIFFRYEYKIYKKGYNGQVIRVDKLTGKAIWYMPEYQQPKSVRKENNTGLYDDIDREVEEEN